MPPNCPRAKGPRHNVQALALTGLFECKTCDIEFDAKGNIKRDRRQEKTDALKRQLAEQQEREARQEEEDCRRNRVDDSRDDPTP